MLRDDNNTGSKEAEAHAQAKLQEWKVTHDEQGRPLIGVPARNWEGVSQAEVVFNACLYGYAGSAAAGGAFGCVVFPIVGLPFGLFFAAIAGVIPTLLAGALLLTVVGRLPPASVLSWAGSLAGVSCFATFSSGAGFPAPLIAYGVGAGLFGAIGAHLMTHLGFAKFYGEQPRVLPERRFTIREGLLATAWFALLMTVLQLYMRLTGSSWPAVLSWFAVSLGCTIVVELFAIAIKGSPK